MHSVPKRGLDIMEHERSMRCWCLPCVVFCSCGDVLCDGEALVVHAGYTVPGALVNWWAKARSSVPEKILKKERRRPWAA